MSHLRACVCFALVLVLFGAGCFSPAPSSSPSPRVLLDTVPSNETKTNVATPIERFPPASIFSQGPIAWTPNDYYAIAIATVPIQTWISIDRVATSTNLCIDPAYQNADAFQKQILSKFQDSDLVYTYEIRPKDEDRGNPWTLTVIPNRLGLMNVTEINKAFAWVGGCEAGMVGLYAFNERWIAFGDGCGESGGPDIEYACHKAMEGLSGKIVLR